ncbi:SGNH/GDSL hydrolase family protein [Variovorax sp. PAMC 28711]|uniref:SGNH/GDSL hydrolase family protein n=1 Tax=Variovorax sp. PAMC 28711 TaxID=1795631 RepID=UPI001F31CD4E|nr:SGNH/GDSL hydrolase family protein [Variovorax sp. PAMC 28711]
MRPVPLVRSALLALSLALAAGFAAQAQLSVPAVDPDAAATLKATDAARARWRSELEAYDAADRERPPPEGSVLFVGSSTIRLWPHFAQDFQQQTPHTINRGVGGSTMAECSLLVRDLVLRYKPRQVVVYAGDNDLAEGRTPLQILESFARFARAVRAELPNARITFVSVKPSPSRERLLPQVRETNNIITAYLNTLGNSAYVDIFTPMLGADGRPRPELFRPDRLHMNESGYALWRSLIASHLLATAPPTLPPTQ